MTGKITEVRNEYFVDGKCELTKFYCENPNCIICEIRTNYDDNFNELEGVILLNSLH